MDLIVRKSNITKYSVLLFWSTVVYTLQTKNSFSGVWLTVIVDFYQLRKYQATMNNNKMIQKFHRQPTVGDCHICDKEHDTIAHKETEKLSS